MIMDTDLIKKIGRERKEIFTERIKNCLQFTYCLVANIPNLFKRVHRHLRTL